jgi:hypothetical protein
MCRGVESRSMKREVSMERGYWEDVERSREYKHRRKRKGGRVDTGWIRICVESENMEGRGSVPLISLCSTCQREKV